MLRTLVILFFVTLIVANPVRAADVFLSVIDDLPVMNGMTEVEDAAVSFETANGRIAEAAIVGAVPVEEVRAFYDAVLPQFGWVRQSDESFVREGERLRLAITSLQSGQTSVRYSLSPDPAR